MEKNQITNVVWFKRDLRSQDNLVLLNASKNGPILPLYILEPELWSQGDMSYRQYTFLMDSLGSLEKQLSSLNLDLVLKVGNAIDVFDSLKQKHISLEIWSYQETWNNWTFRRDLAVKKWVNRNNINWREYPRNGVVRGLKTRDFWASQWYKEMKKPLVALPKSAVGIYEPSDQLPSAKALGIEYDGIHEFQNGSRIEAEKILNDFLSVRGRNYNKEMSSPVTAFNSCSRLSPYLAFGVISIREVYKAIERKKMSLNEIEPSSRSGWGRSLKSYVSRLRWHCHFIQKLEDEPRIETENLHPSFDGIREPFFDLNLFEAWKSGNTGYPMVDACMKALIATGWINFRMRAMLTSFASYHLWLHWRETSLWLARLFTDYEPGIHYSQIQMQSGTTGINSVRIYNPIKQGFDHDPNGEFVKSWLPSLGTMPKEYIHTPWELPEKLNGYPHPVVEERHARELAAKKIYEVRKTLGFRSRARNIYEKHGSRKRSTQNTFGKRDKMSSVILQKELPL